MAKIDEMRERGDLAADAWYEGLSRHEDDLWKDIFAATSITQGIWTLLARFGEEKGQQVIGAAISDGLETYQSFKESRG